MSPNPTNDLPVTSASDSHLENDLTSKTPRKKAVKKVAVKKAVKKAMVSKKSADLELTEEKKETKKPATKRAAIKKVAVKKVAKKAVKAPVNELATELKPLTIEPAIRSAPVSIEIAPAPLPIRSIPQQAQNFARPRPLGRAPGASAAVSSGENDQEGYQGISRSKKRREKRKKRRDYQGEGEAPRAHDQERRAHREPRPQVDHVQIVFGGPIIAVNGILEMTPKGYGFLRLAETNFEQAKEDVFVSPDFVRRYSLRHGQWLHGQFQSSNRGPQLVELERVNDLEPERAAALPHFDELKAINPTKRIAFETTPDRFTTRVVDIVAPIGRGQRGLIVSPPRSGKTTLLLHMAEAIREKYEEQIHLMILLVDERPEEVTEFRRALPGAEIYASSNDEQARNHCRIAELAIDRAKRLVEAGKDVFLLMDSITRLARAYNGNMSKGPSRNRATGSGGITIGALEIPRRLFAAARNTRGGGSLTILATALIQTNSRADDAIFMEFKGTGNMELVLDRKIAESYVYPAVDIFKSGTRREELLLAEHTLHKVHLIRRGLSGHRPLEAMERLLYFIKKFPNNPQMLLEIKG